MTIDAGRVDETDQAAGMPTTEDVMRFLRNRFGDQYPESYEHGKREFIAALEGEFGLDNGSAHDVVDALERGQRIRFRDRRGGTDAEGPRLGLLDEPRSPASGGPVPDFAGHYWELARDSWIPDLP